MVCDNFESDGDLVFVCRHCGELKADHYRTLRIPLTDLPKNDAKVIEEKNYKMTADQKKDFLEAQLKEMWAFIERRSLEYNESSTKSKVIADSVQEFTDQVLLRLVEMAETL